MNKKICDNCNTEINESNTYYTLESKYKERDFGIRLTFKTVDLCSLKCLTGFIEGKRRASVIKATITENDITKIVYSWENIEVSEEELETKENKFYLTKTAYEKYKK